MEPVNGRWFLQIVDRDSGNLYPIYHPVPCSDFLIPRKLIVIGCCLNFVYNIFLRVLWIIFPLGGGGGELNREKDTSPRVERGSCVSFWTCWREISGDRVALFFNKYSIVWPLYCIPRTNVHGGYYGLVVITPRPPITWKILIGLLPYLAHRANSPRWAIGVIFHPSSCISKIVR